MHVKHGTYLNRGRAASHHTQASQRGHQRTGRTALKRQQRAARNDFQRVVQPRIADPLAKQPLVSRGFADHPAHGLAFPALLATAVMTIAPAAKAATAVAADVPPDLLTFFTENVLPYAAHELFTKLTDPLILTTLSAPIVLGGVNTLLHKIRGQPLLPLKLTEMTMAPMASVPAVISFLTTFSDVGRSITYGADPHIVGALALTNLYLMANFLILGSVSLRVMNWIHSEIPRPTTVVDASPLSFPTLADKLRERGEANPYRTAVQDLERCLQTPAGHDLLRYLKFDPATFDLAGTLQSVRISESLAGKAENKGIAAAQYYFPGFLLFTGDRPKSSNIAHELTHALHHIAIARALSRSDLYVALEQVRTIEEMDPQREIVCNEVRAYLNESRYSDPVPDGIRRAGSMLIIEAIMHRHPARMEAIGTAFDTKIGSRSERLKSWLEERVVKQWTGRWMTQPIAWLAGLMPKNQSLRTLHGYGNKRMRRKMYRMGLIESVLQ